MLNVGTVENWIDGTGFISRRLRSIVMVIVAPCLAAASLLAFSASAQAVSYAVNSSTQAAGDYPELEVALSQLAVENRSDYLSKIEINMPEGMSIHTRATEVPWCSTQDFRENDDVNDADCDPQTRVGKLVAHGPSTLARGLILEEMRRDCRRADNDPNKLPGVPDFICIPFENNDEAGINAIMDLAMRPFENIEGNIYLGEIPERSDRRRGETLHVPIKARLFVSLPFPKPLGVTDEFDTQIFGRNIGRDVPREFLKFACNIEIRQIPYIGHPLAIADPAEAPNSSDGGTKVTCLPPGENMWMSNNIELVLQDNLDDLRQPQVTNPTKCGSPEFRASFFGRNGNPGALIDREVRPTTGAYVVDNCASLAFRPEGRAYWRASDPRGPTLVQAFLSQPFYKDEGREAHLKKVVVRFPEHRLHIPDERHWCEPPADSADDCPSGYTVGSVGMYGALYGKDSSSAERFWTKDNKFFGRGYPMPPENDGKRLRVVTFGHSIYNRYRIETVLEEDDDGVTMTVDNFPQMPFRDVQIHLNAFPRVTNGVIQTPLEGYCPVDPVTATYFSHAGQRVEQQLGEPTVVDYSLQRGGFYDCSDYREQFGGFDQPQEKPRNASSGPSSKKSKKSKKSNKANRAKGKHKRTKSRAFRGR